jgi:hypothetical protein
MYEIFFLGITEQFDHNRSIVEWLIEWLLLNANPEIVQLYQCENNLIFDEMMIKISLLSNKEFV